MAATAKPDGYTIGMVVSTIVRIPLMQKVAYNPFEDFTHIMQVCEVSVGVVTRADQPFKSLQDVIAHARAHPGSLTYGSPGVGSGAHFAMEHMARSAGVSLTHVPFRGAPEGTAAVLGGHIALFISAFEWKPQVAAGELRLLAVLAESRRATWPDVPTFKEQGFAQSLRPASFGIAGPRGMDPAIVRRLHEAFKSALDDKAVGAILERHELVPSYLNAEDYRRRLEEDAKVDAELVAALGLKRKE